MSTPSALVRKLWYSSAAWTRCSKKNKSLGLDADDREEILQDNTRRIYTAATSAGCMLLVTYKRPGSRKILLAESKDKGGNPHHLARAEPAGGH